MNSSSRARHRPPFVALAALALTTCMLAPVALAQSAPRAPEFAVGMRQVEHVDRSDGTARTLVMNVFYPAVAAAVPASTVAPLFFVNVDAYRDADVARATAPFPLIMFSHGRGSSGLMYAWFAAYLASRGYVVAALDHYRANRNDASIVYLANKLWQRPVDVALDITYLTTDPFWRKVIDPERIGIAGHSQGGFTALWIGGANVNPERYLAFQRRWRNDLTVPKHLRDALPVDAAPALQVADRRVKAAFAMAPGLVQGFGGSRPRAGIRNGCRRARADGHPAYLTVGAADTATPPPANAAFAAQHIRNAQLVVIPGAGHEIFVNECNEDGRLELPDTCVDAPGIDRAKIHADVGAAALRFFDASLRR